MLFNAVFLSSVLISISVFPFVIQAKLSADCTFEEIKSWKSGQNMSALPLKFSGQLPSSRNLSRESHTCLVKADNSSRLLYLRAKRNEESKNGSLHVSAYGGGEESFQIGHLDIPKSAVGWSSLPFCPSVNEASERHLTFSGTTDLSFTVEMLQEESIELNDPRKVKLSARNSYPAVYQFAPTEDISNKQLDVTVTSESDVPAYLKVSRDCKDVKDNIDVVDYKGESLRLSFAKKGRITLSKFSIPPLTDSTSSWFIGIAIKNATGDTPVDATKTVTLTLTRSFDYSYTHPMGVSQGAICVLCGLTVSLWAWWIFRECICSQCSAKAEDEPLVKIRVTWCDFFSAMGVVICKYSFGRGPKTYSYITFIVGSVLMVGAFQFVFADWYLMIHEGDRDHCYYNDFCYRVRYADIPYNLIVSNLTYVLHGVILAVNVLCMESDVLARCGKLAPIAKREIENRQKQKKEREKKERKQNKKGRSEDQNRSTDNESHVELPNHVMTCPDISLHLEKMLVPKVKTVELELFAEARKKKFSFSMGYAFAWALCFEGMFSALYHLCPSKLTFQFDTAFMFVIAGLSVVLLYNGIEMQECSANVEAKRIIGAANFFLFFVVPLFIFNYFGTMYHSEAGLATAIKIPFFIFLIVWCIAIAVWAGYKLCAENNNKNNINNDNVVFDCDCCDCCKCCKRCEDCCTRNVVLIVFCVLGILVTPVVLGILWGFKIIEFTDVFLWLCIAESSIAALGFFCMGRKNCNFRDYCKSSCQFNCHNDNFSDFLARVWGCCKGACRFCIKMIHKLLISKMVHKLLFSSIILTLQVAALIIFFDKETTDKGKTPEKSRDLNQECFFLDFFDYHDIWHILSSFGLLMGALMVIHVSYESPKLIKKESRTQATEGVTNESQRTALTGTGSPVNYDSPETAGCSSEKQNPSFIAKEEPVIQYENLGIARSTNDLQSQVLSVDMGSPVSYDSPETGGSTSETQNPVIGDICPGNTKQFYSDELKRKVGSRIA